MNEINVDFESFFQMISLAASGANGRRVDLSDKINWQAVIQYAQEQAVLPLIACSLSKDTTINCPQQVREHLRQMVMDISGSNLVRRQRAIQLLSAMEESGLQVKLIKGYAVGTCYTNPEVRDSTDIDILINKEQENSVYEFLANKGFIVSHRGRTEHHAVCLHPKFGKYEVHVQLYNEMVRDMWFRMLDQNNMLTEDSVSILCDGMTYKTLGYTDHLIFLTLHLIKHFIHSGINVRMMIDVAQFFSCNKEKIDVIRYWTIIKELHFITLVNCIFWIMIDTKCYSFEDFPMLHPQKPEGINLIIQDLITGGNMGVKDEKRCIASYEYTRLILLSNKNQQQYQFYMLKHKFRSAYNQMLPAKEQMTNIYPILKEHNWLFPFFKLHRFITYPLNKIRTGVLKEQIRRDIDELPAEIKDRFEMFFKLNMIW